MPKFDFNVEETSTAPTGSAFALTDGWYVMKIVDMGSSTTNWGDQQVDIHWDVAEGPEAGKCADWGEYSNLTHLALSGRGAGFTKHFLHMVTESNPGFKAGEAFTEDRFADFAGKIFEARTEQRDSRKVSPKTGRPYRNTVIAEVASAEDARSKADVTQPDERHALEIAEDDITF